MFSKYHCPLKGKQLQSQSFVNLRTKKLFYRKQSVPPNSLSHIPFSHILRLIKPCSKNSQLRKQLGDLKESIDLNLLISNLKDCYQIQNTARRHHQQNGAKYKISFKQTGNQLNINPVLKGELHSNYIFLCFTLIGLGQGSVTPLTKMNFLFFPKLIFQHHLHKIYMAFYLLT